jgi:4-amino-4-deoxy-L-arabinose transferase-like glycosyltransferase
MTRVLLLLLALVLLGVLARLYRIDAPLLEYRMFRQQDTAAIARNFYENGMNILYPQVDWRGDSPGYVEVEFPIYNFVVALLYHVFGAQEWVGRAVNIVVYALSALLFFRFMRRLTDERTSLFAVFFYSFAPLSVYFTRAFQPDALLALASLVAIYYFWVWTEEQRLWTLVLSAVGFSLAVLIKPPSLYVGLPLLYLAYRRFGGWLLYKPALWLFAAGVLLPPLLWYSHALHLWNTYGNTFGILGVHTVMGIWPVTDWHWLALGWHLIMRLLFEIATPPGVIILLIGFFAKAPARINLLGWWLAGFAVYVLLVPRGHYGHDYYQLPIVFVAAAYMAFGMSFLLDKKVLPRVVMAVVLLAVVGCSAWQLHSMLHIKEFHWDWLAFGKRVNQLTEQTAGIIFVSPRPFDPPIPEIYRHRTTQGERLYSLPTDFYLSHRKGWSVDEVQATPDFVEILRQRGAKYFVTFFPEIFKRHPNLKATLDASYLPVEVNSRWAIYKLTWAAP